MHNFTKSIGSMIVKNLINQRPIPRVAMGVPKVRDSIGKIGHCRGKINMIVNFIPDVTPG
jgi:hypothetical protein